MKNKKGISLIVLVITIIVIIILAAAVILTLTENNPINNAKVASMAQSKDSVESAINLYTAKIIAETQGAYTNSNIILGDVSGTSTNAIASTTGTITMDTVAYYPITAADFKTKVGMTLPTLPAGAAWYITPASNKAYIIFPTGTTAPAWLSTALATDTTLQGFVLIQPAG